MKKLDMAVLAAAWALLLLLILAGTDAYAHDWSIPGYVTPPQSRTGPPRIYSPDGRYLGNLSDNPYDPNSTSNPYGRYGSTYSPDSINNPYGVYGNPYSPKSPNNPYAW